MRNAYRWGFLVLSAVALGGLWGCSSGSGAIDSASFDGGTTSETVTVGPDPSLFVAGALLSAVTIEDCTLSGGTETSCFRIEIQGTPAARNIGPFCPPTIFSDDEEGGIWFDGSGEVYDIDGDFIVNLANMYGDGNWLLYDPNSGDVNVTDTQTACEAAARPDVDEQYQNYCVECAIEYYGGGVSRTFLLPTEPVALAAPANFGRGDIGVTLDGVVVAPPAPVDAILGAYTIAAFDDCGGHVNPIEGYHYHAATGCADVVTQDDGHGALMGYALDGYSLFALLDADSTEPAELDECRGHTDDTRGYHYHAASAGENRFIGCFHGEQGMVF